MDFETLARNYRPNTQPTAPPKQRGHGGFLSSLISEGGAIGGAVAGTAIAPGLGTIIGAALGGFGGRLGENKIRDDEFRVGDAAKEGVLSGAFAGIAPLYRAGKAGYAASKGAKALTLTDDVARAAGSFTDEAAKATKGLGNMKEINKLLKQVNSGKELTKSQLTKLDTFTKGAAGAATNVTDDVARTTMVPNSLDDILREARRGFSSVPGAPATAVGDKTSRLATIGKSIDKSASGLKVGTSLGGGKVLTPSNSDDLYNFLRKGSEKYLKKPITPGAPLSQASQADDLFKGVTKSLDDVLTGINRKVAPREINKVVTNATKTVADDAFVTSKTTNTLNKLVEKMKRTKDLKGLEAIRREADKIAFTQTGVGKTSAAAQANAVRQAIDDFITPLSKQYKTIKGDWSKANQLVTLTSKASNSAKGLNFFGLPLVPGQVRQGGLSKIGGGISGAGSSRAAGALGTARGAVRSAMPNVAPQLIGRGLTGDFEDQMSSNIDTMSPQTSSPTMNQSMGVLSDFDSNMSNTSTMQSQPNSLAQALADPAIQQQILITDLLDPNSQGSNISKLQTIFSLSAPAANAAPELNANQQKTVMQMNNALSVLDALGEDFANAGGGQGIGGIFASQLAKIPGVNDPVNLFNQRREAATGILARALGEVGTLTDQDIKRALGNVPKIDDSPAVAEGKLMRIRQLLADIANNAISAPQSNPQDDLASVMAAYQGVQ